MSIAAGESRWYVYARPYFRERVVCPCAYIEIGSLLVQLSAIWRVKSANRANCVRLSLAVCRPKRVG